MIKMKSLNKKKKNKFSIKKKKIKKNKPIIFQNQKSLFNKKINKAHQVTNTNQNKHPKE